MKKSSKAPALALPTPWDALPSALDTEAFREKWTAYVAYRKQMKFKPLPPVSAAVKWKQMAQWGHDEALAQIDECMGNGWQGIQAPREGKGGRKSGGSEKRPDFSNGF